MHESNVIMRLFLGLSLWDTFIMWKLHFSRFLKKAFLIILEIRYLHVQLLCMLGPNFWITLLWYVCITHWNDRVIYLFNVITFFDDVRITLYFDMFGLRMGITLKLRFVFALHCDILSLRHNYVIYLFNVVTFSNNVRITSYFGTLELGMEITLQLRFVFACHCDVYFITSQLRYLFVRCGYVFWWR